MPKKKYVKEIRFAKRYDSVREMMVDLDVGPVVMREFDRLTGLLDGRPHNPITVDDTQFEWLWNGTASHVVCRSGCYAVGDIVTIQENSALADRHLDCRIKTITTDAYAGIVSSYCVLGLELLPAL